MGWRRHWFWRPRCWRSCAHCPFRECVAPTPYPTSCAADLCVRAYRRPVLQNSSTRSSGVPMPKPRSCSTTTRGPPSRLFIDGSHLETVPPGRA